MVNIFGNSLKKTKTLKAQIRRYFTKTDLKLNFLMKITQIIKKTLDKNNKNYFFLII